MKCRICGCETIETEISVREMMIPTREDFLYFECANCHCMQIKEVPDNLDDYYGQNYYSFQNKEILPDETPVTDMTPILDVGCGAGEFLKKLRAAGYGNLYGCDPFLQNDIAYGENIHIYKKTVHEMTGQYDKIFLNDSFEHVTDPHEVMESLKRLLSAKGIVRIAIPVYPNIAYDMFGANWYQLDAPRHICLHSGESMEYLVKEHGFHIVDITYDSHSSQIFRSYLYEKDVPFWEQKMEMIRQEMSSEEINEICQMTEEVNEKSYGDHAVFSLMHA